MLFRSAARSQPYIACYDRGQLDNPADRDHCMQYMVAIALLKGSLVAEDYEKGMARDPRIDFLRERIEIVEQPDFSRDYHDPAKRSIANAVQIFLRDGTATQRIVVEYPLGHPRRRAEGLPLLLRKFERNLRSHFRPRQADAVLELCQDHARLEQTPVNRFMDLFVSNNP